MIAMQANDWFLLFVCNIKRNVCTDKNTDNKPSESLSDGVLTSWSTSGHLVTIPVPGIQQKSHAEKEAVQHREIGMLLTILKGASSSAVQPQMDSSFQIDFSGTELAFRLLLIIPHEQSSV